MRLIELVGHSRVKRASRWMERVEPVGRTPPVTREKTSRIGVTGR
ncbi:hypothetical protein [Rhodococcus rhodochrous]